MRYLLYGCIALFIMSCQRAVFKPKWTSERSPSTYIVRFETTKGKFDVRVQREWSPAASDRFYQLVKHKFYDSAIFYRVVPNFVAQFGGIRYAEQQKWATHKIVDEPVLHRNKTGTISFGRDSVQSRTATLFINLKDNSHLDTMNLKNVTGFPAFGEVINGMDVVSALYSKHGSKPMNALRTMYTNRTEFFNLFPGLDVILKAHILKK